MLKMGLPAEAVKHAMIRYQLDPNIMDLDSEKSLQSQLKKVDAPPANNDLPLKDDPKYHKYFKMIKMVRTYT